MQYYLNQYLSQYDPLRKGSHHDQENLEESHDVVQQKNDIDMWCCADVLLMEIEGDGVKRHGWMG